MSAHIGHDGQGATTGRAAIIIASRGRRMMIAMLVMGRVANEGDIDLAIMVPLPEAGVFHMAVLMNGRHGSMLVIAMESWKNEADSKEYEKAGDKAVPLHDPEQRA